MYLFRQKQQETMKPVAFITTSNKPDFGGLPTGKYSANKTKPESGYFTVEKVQPDDSGVYFCAVSKHSDTDLLYCCTKTYIFNLLSVSQIPFFGHVQSDCFEYPIMYLRQVQCFYSTTVFLPHYTTRDCILHALT